MSDKGKDLFKSEEMQSLRDALCFTLLKGFYAEETIKESILKKEIAEITPQNNSYICNLDGVTKFAKEFGGVMEQVASACMPFIEALSGITQNIAVALNSWISNNIKSYILKNIHFYIADKKFTPASINEQDLLKQIRKFYSDKKYFELIRLFDEWDNYAFIKKRMPLLNSCKNVIVSNLKTKDMLNVVIPVLLSQIDGIAKDLYILINPKFKNQKIISHSNVISQGHLKGFTKDKADLFIDIIHYIFCYESGVKDSKGNYIKNAALPKEMKKYELNRNGIMHGSKLNYGKKIELIRLVLFLDSIIKTTNELMKQYENQNNT